MLALGRGNFARRACLQLLLREFPENYLGNICSSETSKQLCSTCWLEFTACKIKATRGSLEKLPISSSSRMECTNADILGVSQETRLQRVALDFKQKVSVYLDSNLHGLPWKMKGVCFPAGQATCFFLHSKARNQKV